MDDDPQPPSPKEPDMFRFVEAGMRLTYECKPIGEIKAALGQTIEFYPVLTCQGFSGHKEFVASLRLKHRIGGRGENPRCLVDRDEVNAWGQLLRCYQAVDFAELQVSDVEYVSRHGIRMLLKPHLDGRYVPYLLHIASPQAAILPLNFANQMLEIFDDFESFCQQYT